MISKGNTKEEKRCLQEQKRAERQRKQLDDMFKPAPGVALITSFWGAWARKTGQSNRRYLERSERDRAIAKLGPIDSLAHLVSAMGWHQYHAHILIVATHPGVTCHELTKVYGLAYPNHRMVFRRLNVDLAKLDWRFISSPLTAQNAPWGWWLEPT